MSYVFFSALRVFFISVFLYSCSTFQAMNTQQLQYKNYLYKNLKQAKIFERGRELMSLSALVVNSELKKLQEEKSPGFSVELHSEQHQFIVSLGMASWGRFSAQKLQFKLDGVLAAKIHEIRDQNKIFSFYPHAYPQERVFLVSFPVGSGSYSQLQLNSVFGALEVKYGK